MKNLSDLLLLLLLALYLVDMWSYDAKTDTWSPVQDFGGSKREGATAVVYKDKAYVGFGNNNGVAQKNLYVFDPNKIAGRKSKV